MGKTYRSDKRDFWDRNENYGWSSSIKKRDKNASKAEKRLKVHKNMKRRIEDDRENDDDR